jgi:beta-phosphoglucomutase-like phosphatase (HAD superfamily)
MSKAVMFDLGGTLVDGQSVLPGVPAALETIASFTDATGAPIPLCLVSDYDLVTPPVTPAKIQAKFNKYLTLLEGFGLATFFEPADRHITLSTHAGVLKPDARLFHLALERLGTGATLPECVFLTENQSHVQHCRQVLGMKALHFTHDFTHWSEAPLLVANLLGEPANVERAIAPWCEAHGLASLSVCAVPNPSSEKSHLNRWHAEGTQWVPVTSEELGTLSGVHVNLPASLDLDIDPETGRIAAFQLAPPAPAALEESIDYVSNLLQRGAVETPSGARSVLKRPTHRIEQDAQGRRFLRRKGFSH